ncbi:MAG: GNAT family N-acetyltransferase [Faecousia sp.]
MEFLPKTILLKDGRQALLRSPRAEDAAPMLDYFKTVSGETEYLLRYPEECTMSEGEEAAFLSGALESDTQLMICCFVEGRLAGNSMLSMNTRLKIRHRASVAIGLLREYWGLGIGTALFQELIAIGKERGLDHLELDYIEGNQRARRLYEKMGFVQTAEVPDVYRLRDGSFRKSILMMKKL